jgi:hypothetical protein
MYKTYFLPQLSCKGHPLDHVLMVAGSPSLLIKPNVTKLASWLAGPELALPIMAWPFFGEYHHLSKHPLGEISQ